MATEFEKQVYRIVAEIPRGEVRSYRWVAEKIGSPRAYRAVGNALNKNRHPQSIPCHRVIRSDGSIGGYAKGSALKVDILRREGLDVDKMRCYNRKQAAYPSSLRKTGVRHPPRNDERG